MKIKRHQNIRIIATAEHQKKKQQSQRMLHVLLSAKLNF